MLVKTNELSGIALDWAVAKCENRPWHVIPEGYYLGGKLVASGEYNWETDTPIQLLYSTDWAQGGVIIDKYSIEVVRGLDAYVAFTDTYWHPNGTEHGNMYSSTGASYLEAAMRCYVASKLGDAIDIPEEILK